jgi:AAA15 family ATPase/GTPase
MLIQLTVRNWRSVRDEQTFSLVKAKGGELTESNTFDPETPATGDLLRSAAIYGPNAAGKSNLINALRTMTEIVIGSENPQPGNEIPVKPFVLDSRTEKEPTEFEVVFSAKQVRYQYGFSATNERIMTEWLIAYPNGRAQNWFTREWKAESNNYDWSFGNSFSGQKQVWQESTLSNALFLSIATKLNSKQLKPVFNWFKYTLRFSSVAGWTPNYTASQCETTEQKARVLDFLRAADLDIKDVDVQSEKFSAKHLPDDLPEEIKKDILENMKDNIIYDIKTIHKGTQDQAVAFEFDDESDGTQKLFSYAGPWLNVLETGRVLLIDELHDNLHPKLVRFLVDLFHSSETNPKNAQLIFTTHETSILNQDVFRRDQIWFCEKNKDQATSLYPLTDFSPRKGRENLEDAYLSGRYGALPYVRSIRSTRAG